MKLESAVFAYLYMYLPYIVEMLILTVISLCKQRRRKYFWVWLGFGLPLLAAFVFFVACIQSTAPNSPLLNFLSYIIQFVLLLLLLSVCYNVPFKIILFYGIIAYAVQNMSYRIGTLLEITGVVWRFSELVGYSAASGIVYNGIFAAVAILFWAFCVRRINSKGVENVYSRNVLVLSVFVLAITVVLCGYSNMYWWMSVQLSIINYCFAILGNLLVLVIQLGMTERAALKTDVEAVRRLWALDRRQYEIAKENIELINIKCHDMKHQLRLLRGSKASEAEIAEIEKCIAIYDSKVNTGSEPLDVLLNEKSLLCNENGIRLDCMVDGKPLAFMNDYDLYSLFGNMLSNAIEAELKLCDEEKKIISLTAICTCGMIFIDCRNYFDGNIKSSGGAFVTGKPDYENHGFGVKSMQMLVNKYGGVIDLSYDEGMFAVRICLPLKTRGGGGYTYLSR